MVSELYLYDRDKGLFKKILNKSRVIKGRYHVAPNYGHELNTNNLDQYFKESGLGQTNISQKYPCCVCIAPRSRKVNINGSVWEEYYFTLFFLTTTYYTGDNQIKSPDLDTNASTHHVWYDWADMKAVADDFMQVFGKLIKTNQMTVAVDFSDAITNRLSKFNNDRVSGVSVSFRVLLYVGVCELTDYDESDVADIEMPDLNIHAAHKH